MTTGIWSSSAIAIFWIKKCREHGQKHCGEHS